MKALSARALRGALAGLLAACVLPLGALAQDLVPVGEAVGIEASTAGLLVASLARVSTPSGEACPAEEAGVQPGDILTRLGSTELKEPGDFARALAMLDGSETGLTLVRDEKTLQLSVRPVQDTDGVWRLGLWLRASVSGLGTVTYYDPDTGEYGALGHGINDADTGVLLPIGGGSIARAEVDEVVRGERGRAGELHGPAVIISDVSGGPAEYDVEIKRDGERLLVTVTDPELLKTTGGIVQGMSGSPIIQDGRLVGAVTHVLVSAPARGYGVTIGAMLEAEKAA